MITNRERQLVLKFFSDYYKTAELNVPSLEKREIGVGFEKKIDARHMSFETKDLLRAYLVDNPPFFISYSTAYYERPATTPIEKKGWLGADLVFDLDTHAEGKYAVYSKLETVKQDAIRLVEEFLIPDFGLSKNEIFYVFSGNRGYHIHVRSDAVYSLGTDERREIVDYIRGVGLDFNSFFSEGERKGTIQGPRPSDFGYRGRFVDKVLYILEKEPQKIYRGFSDPEKKRNFLEGISQGNWSRLPFSSTQLMAKLTPIAKELPLLTVDADAAVTYDIKKLIRMPNTIHGETGFIAKEVKNMDSFEPLMDALIHSKEILNVEFIEPVPEITLRGTIYSFSQGQKIELPKEIGLFFVLKGSAKLYYS